MHGKRERVQNGSRIHWYREDGKKKEPSSRDLSIANSIPLLFAPSYTPTTSHNAFYIRPQLLPPNLLLLDRFFIPSTMAPTKTASSGDKYSVILPTFNERKNLPIVAWLLNRTFTEKYAPESPAWLCR